MSPMTTDRQTKAEAPARPTTLDEVRPLATIPVYSATKPNAAGLLGLTRWTAYSEVRAGRIPTLQVGQRYRVLVPALRRLLGDLPPLETEAAAGR